MKSSVRKFKRSPLISFLSTNNFLVRGRGTPQQEITHTLMDGAGGGKICLPDSAISGFFDAYGAELESGNPAFVIERRSPTFKMHFDMDFTDLMPDVETVQIVNTICETVCSFMPGAPAKHSWCIVCAVLDDSKVRKSPGLHLVFP